MIDVATQLTIAVWLLLEAVLSELRGYADYVTRTKRLVPGLW